MRKGWEIKELDTICEINYGTRVVNKRDGGSTYPVFGGGGATFFMDSYNREDCFIVARFAMSKQCTRFVSGKFFLNDSGLSVKPKNNELLQDFLNMQLFYLNDYIYSLSKGAAQKNLDVPIFRKIKITYPKSISEQQEIVSIINDSFESIDIAKLNAEQNLKNAKELFESYLQDIFEKKGEDWEEESIGDLLVKTETIDPTKTPNKEFIYIDVSSVNKESKVIETANKLLGKDAPSRARKLIRTNDVIFATVRPTHCRVAIITEEFDNQVCSTGYFVLRAKEIVSNKLIFYFFLTNKFNKQMEKLQRGANYPAVNDADVKGIIISFPKSLKEQNNIVRKLDVLSLEIKNLESIYQNKLNDLEELKKSILSKAFNGELKTSKISS